MVCSATTKSRAVAVAAGAPLPGLRSKHGKFELECPPKPAARLEHLAGGDQIDRVLVDAVRTDRLGPASAIAMACAHDAIGDAHRAPVWPHVCEPGGEVGVGGRRRRVQCHTERAGHLEAFRQVLGQDGVGEPDIGSGGLVRRPRRRGRPGGRPPGGSRTSSGRLAEVRSGASRCESARCRALSPLVGKQARVDPLKQLAGRL